MGKHSSADQWAAWVAEQQASELTVVEFCEWIGVSQPRVGSFDHPGFARRLNQWTSLNRYLEDGNLSIDNNASERAMRPA